MELLELWQVALSAESATALDMRKYMTTSLVSNQQLVWGPSLSPTARRRAFYGEHWYAGTL